MIHFVTAADKEYYGRLEGLIYSIHKHCKEFTISVYDLGLLPSEVEMISKVKHVTVKQVERSNPNILTKLRSHPAAPENDSVVTGLYSWKPVILKQELDIYDAIIYMDAGTMLVSSPDKLWEFINKEGHWFLGISDTYYMTPKSIIQALQVDDDILASQGINAGIQGLTRKVYDNYIMPCYRYTKDINLFVDDGTSGGGNSSGRHDQTLFSIQAARAGLRPNNPFHIVDDKKDIREDTIIHHCRGNSTICNLKELW